MILCERQPDDKIPLACVLQVHVAQNVSFFTAGVRRLNTFEFTRG